MKSAMQCVWLLCSIDRSAHVRKEKEGEIDTSFGGSDSITYGLLVDSR